MLSKYVISIFDYISINFTLTVKHFNVVLFFVYFNKVVIIITNIYT